MKRVNQCTQPYNVDPTKLVPERPTNKALFTVVNALLLRPLPFPIAAG